MIPFAVTRAERMAKGDPRLSVEERYATPAAYVEAVQRAVHDLLRQRLLLQEDANAMLKKADAAPLAK